MKIQFICGSVEPGKDGVGDYTRTLAAELINLGMDACVIALRDKGVNTVIEQLQSQGDEKVPVLRIPYTMKWSESVYYAQIYSGKFKPDWVSLQYVPFSFHPKGLPFNLPKTISRLTDQARLHIMFHELWVGIKTQSPFSHHLYKIFQKNIARSLIKNNKPAKVNTSNRVYQLALQDAGINAEILPLFSNIPYISNCRNYSENLLMKAGIQQGNRAQYKIICVFGSIFPDIKLDDVLEAELQMAKNSGKQLLLIFMGRSNQGEVERLTSVFATRIKVLRLGELPPDEVSAVMQQCDQAISTTPKEFIGKSGVYAVFKRHGLPVNCPFSISIPAYENEIEKAYQLLESRKPEEWDVSNTAKKIYDNFSMYTNV